MGATPPEGSRYGKLAIGLHWLSAALVLAAVALIEMKGWLPKEGGMRAEAKLWHFQVGALVLLATVVRVACRVVDRQPKAAAPRLAAAAHGLLYVLLLALPASGMALLVAAGKPVSLLGWDLPVWAEGGKALAKGAKRLHETAGTLMLVLVAMHVGAALWHQFVRRDGTLARMLPRVA